MRSHSVIQHNLIGSAPFVDAYAIDTGSTGPAVLGSRHLLAGTVGADSVTYTIEGDVAVERVPALCGLSSTRLQSGAISIFKAGAAMAIAANLSGITTVIVYAGVRTHVFIAYPGTDAVDICIACADYRTLRVRRRMSIPGAVVVVGTVWSLNAPGVLANFASVAVIIA